MTSIPTLQELSVLDLVPFGHAGLEGRFFALRLSPPVWNAWQPGQFVMLRPSNWGPAMLLPRPFSICSLTKRDLVIFFAVVGRGTERLARLNIGDLIQVWGPLGRGFLQEPERPTLLLAGGMGLAPLVAYAQTHPTPWSLHLEFGHRMPLGCYPFESFTDKIITYSHEEKSPADLHDFLDLLDTRISEYAVQKGLALACGPLPFLRAVQAMALKHNLPAQLSLENRMACGTGACLGCVVQAAAQGETDFKPTQTCTCGPVFWADQVKLEDS